jgi:hypothetical protein
VEAGWSRRILLYQTATIFVHPLEVVCLTFDYSYVVGRYRERPYHIGVRVDPSFGCVESFAVVLFFRRRDAVRVEVAKVDNTEHRNGTIHVDRYYRSNGAERKDFSTDVSSWNEAEAYLTDRWRRFAAQYEVNHGTDRVA